MSLLAADGSVAASVKWDDSEQVTAIRRMSDGSYAVLPEDEDVIATLENLGDFSIFLQALEVGTCEKMLLMMCGLEVRGDSPLHMFCYNRYWVWLTS